MDILSQISFDKTVNWGKQYVTLVDRVSRLKYKNIYTKSLSWLQRTAPNFSAGEKKITCHLLGFPQNSWQQEKYSKIFLRLQLEILTQLLKNVIFC